MNGFYDPFVEQVRETRTKLLEKYGGTAGYSKHLDEERPRLESLGWHFETPDERARRLAKQQGHA
jgi:uncharacterized protein (DUF427 family)